MSIQSLDLVWIVVDDLKKSVEFYTQVVGMELKELHEEHGWAELAGVNGGTRLGIAQKNDKEAILPGQNAVVTLSVKNLLTSIQEMKKKGAQMVGEIVEIPGMVKLQMAKDLSNNYFQLVETVS